MIMSSWLSNLFGPAEPNSQQVQSLNNFIKDFSGSKKAEHKNVEGRINVAVGEIFLKHVDKNGELNKKEFAQEILSNQELGFHKDGTINGLGQKALKIVNAYSELIESFESDYGNKMNGADLGLAVEKLKLLTLQPNKNEVANSILQQAADGDMPFNVGQALMRFHDISADLQKNLEAFCKVAEFGELQGKSLGERKIAGDIIKSIDDPTLLKRQLTNAVQDNEISEDYAKVIADAAKVSLTHDVNVAPIADNANISPTRTRAPAPPPLQQQKEIPPTAPNTGNVNVSPKQTRAPAPLPGPVQQKEIPPEVPKVIITPTISKAPLTHEEANPQLMLDVLYKNVKEDNKLNSDLNQAQVVTDLLSVASVLQRMKGQSSNINFIYPEMIILQSVLNKFENILNTNPSLASIRDVVKAEDINALRTEYLSAL
jgi:hypothetical protein